jgi:methyltransferase
VTAAVLAAIAALLLVEARISARHETALRARGAHEPPDDVYRSMQITYPGAFVLMGIEGLTRDDTSASQWIAGALIFVLAKSLKYWAMASLGPYWSFRVLVVPGAPLVSHGPYRFARHPNYLGVIGELLGAAILLNARITGPLATLAFAVLIKRRIAVEERALSRSSR